MRLDFAACRRVSMALRTSRGQFAMNHDMHENIDLPLSVGAIAMSASTMIVAANAQLLRGPRRRRNSPIQHAHPRSPRAVESSCSRGR